MPFWVRTLLITASPEEAASAVAARRDALRELASRGRLRAAGEFTQGDGFLEIFEAADRLEAERLTREDPLIARGLASWLLREWTEIDPEGAP